MTAYCLTEMIKTIAANYRYTYKDCPEETMQRMMVSWHESLKAYEDEEVLKAFRVCLLKCKAPPTIADVVERVERARDLKRPSKAEIWENLMDAVDKTKRQVFVGHEYGYKPLYWLKNDECKRIFADQPQSVRKWLGFNAFCALAEMSNTALNVERARFMKEIDAISETIREQQQIAMSELLPISEMKRLK